MKAWTDEEILEGIRCPGQREKAFRELHRRFAPRLLGLLTRMCRGDRDAAEDLLGRALYKAYLALPRMETPCRSLPAWLYTVAARTALDELALRASEEARLCVPLGEHLRAASPGAVDPAADAADSAVEAVLFRLEAEDPRYRTLLEMEHVAACGRDEIAEATGIPRKQIAQYLKR